MSEPDSVAAKMTLHEVATQAYNLAMGLQNAAPPQSTTGSSIKYLVEISLKLEQLSKDIDALWDVPKKK
ncbi:MAG: hypothetical protein ACYCQI_11145 [Gammaproteobacteria bacterium]